MRGGNENGSNGVEKMEQACESNAGMSRARSASEVKEVWLEHNARASADCRMWDKTI